MSDVCWNCGKPVYDLGTGIITVTISAGHYGTPEKVRICCGGTCARKAVVAFATPQKEAA